MHSPSSIHLQALKLIIRYIKAIVILVLDFYLKALCFFMGFLMLIGCPNTQRSTTVYCMFIGSHCVSWSAKKQPTVARSSFETEYRSMTGAATLISSRSLVIGVFLKSPPILYYKYKTLSALYLTKNCVFHARGDI